MSTNSKPVHTPSKRPPRKSSRPATAPAKEDVALLPSLQSSDRKQLHFLAPNNSNMQTLNEDDAASDSTNSLPTTPFEPAMGLGLATSTSNTGSMYDTPMLYKDSPEIVSSSSTLSSLTQSTSAMSMYKQSTAYDWSVFMSAYASGRWDPHKTPNPPAGGSPSMRMLGAMPVDMASTNIALAVNTGSGEIDSAEIDQASLRTTTDRNSPYLKSVPTHRMRNSFSTSSSLSNSRKHISSVPLGLSHSAGTSSAAVEPPNSSQKAKGGLFLNLPSLGLGLDPSPIVSPHNVALQSNALYSNSHHDEVRYTSKYVTPSESAAPAPRPTPPLPLSLSKSSPSSQTSITGGYPATATAGSFTPYHLPAQFHPNHNANATHHNGSSSSTTSSYPPKTHYATSSSSSRPARDFRYPDFPHAPAINAATLRLAGTHVNISPLALPSPEHELTDPMRAAVIVDSSSGRVARDAKLVVTVPGTVPDDIDNISEAVVVRGEDGSMSDGVLIDDEVPEFTNDIMTTPGGTRRRIRISQELKKFWEGTIPTLGEFNSSSVYSGIGGMYDKEAQPKGKTPKRQSPEIRKTEGHDDYFTRGKEFSVASSSSQARLAMPDHIQGELADSTHVTEYVDQAKLVSSPEPISHPSGSSSMSIPATTVPPPITTSSTSIRTNPAPLLTSYSFPYPHAYAAMHPHLTGAMTAPATAMPLSSSADINSSTSTPPQSRFPPNSNPYAHIHPDLPTTGLDSNISSPGIHRRASLMRQISAPLPVGSGSNAILAGSLAMGGSMGTGVGMPPQVLPSLSEAEKSEVVMELGGREGLIRRASGGDAERVTETLEDTDSSLSASMSNSQSLRQFSVSSEEEPQERQFKITTPDPTANITPSPDANIASGPMSTSNSTATVEAMGALINVGQSPSMRAAKEEHMFKELGYLAAPIPPDEMERRRALYKFNIWHTGSDLNFDRIAHLAKLVFNTKGVFISLLDGNEQWFKSECESEMLVILKFNGYLILFDDEPMVILDTLQDWRFANNPHVVNSPHIRFYAGAPLRTQDGHNIGSLAVIDDTRRDEFTPRHRHTLKEFAAIAMREMELWRDKIQLRIRDRIQNSMEQFSRECLEIDMEHPSQQSLENGITDGHSAQSTNASPNLSMTSSMDRVYDRAAKLVQRTLDVEGVIVMDVSHCEVLENMSGESTINVVMHHGDPDVTETTTKSLTAEEYAKLNAFFAKYPDGRVSEGIVPPSIRLFLPTTRIQYALTVPIFNIDKRPFALLCAYNVSDHTKRFLEGHELSYLRAIGVIILSAVLKRRMLLADKAKSLFISNISHELRTPLHGILAAAELLGESDLNHAQESFLQTVKACGTSLVETVNHVLDFTKLSGNSKAGGVENVIIPTKVDLMELIEEAVDGCWIGHRARTASMEDTGIGSVYSPPAEDENKFRKHVEAVIDIGDRREGWLLRCEKGGIRRVLMNVFGNSLKFTSDGFVHVVLRQLPLAEGDPPNKIKIELSVHDTGKNQLFHPFSQENPLQTGTGLGLAIVNSIVTSDSVGGKVDVWSEENVGTEIKVTFLTEVAETDENPEMGVLKLDDFHPPPSVSLVGFDSDHRGIQLLHSVLKTYMTTWWGLEIQEDENELGNIVVLNEDVKLVVEATSRRDTSRPFIVLSASRGNPTILSVAHEYELIGGFCRIIYKPGGPSRIRSALRLCLHALKIGAQNGDSSTKEEQRAIQQSSAALLAANFTYPRRYSEDSRHSTPRPSMSPRSTTVHPTTFSSWTLASSSVPEEKPATPDPDNNEPTITLDSGGTLLKSSIGSIETKAPKVRVLVIEDNLILRTLIVKWLTKKGYDFRDAVDGRDGVNVYTNDGPFDIVLLDLSMPVLDGIGATAEIRKIETSYRPESGKQRCRILALTGMSSLDDKRRAFDAGVDGYLVKPVPFSTLNEVFHKLGIS
ncbi:hypothetical protein BDP27DRAFT_1339078 [Rhodocollybia butyracea]|uniref:histidine kinase n=1 Tax=Rhodocollybia butyracea TaxID=206335 RepID=A0A9P5PCI8_9AGAR|nr:hypothetical protein BDP27DRAFT_1339078 [Rhodocollybia butyracea]